MAKGKKTGRIRSTWGKVAGKVKTAAHRFKTRGHSGKGETTGEMRARVGASRAKSMKKATRRVAVRKKIVSGLKRVGIKATQQSISGVNRRRIAYKMTSARRAALKKAQAASARVRSAGARAAGRISSKTRLKIGSQPNRSGPTKRGANALKRRRTTKGINSGGWQ